MRQISGFIHKLFKKILIVLFISSVFIGVISIFWGNNSKNETTFSFSDIEKTQNEQLYKSINDATLQKTTQGKFSVALFRISSCSLIGEGCDKNPNSKANNPKKSLSHYASQLFIMPFTNPPASGIVTAVNAFNTAGFVPKSLAATKGIGFAAIQPLQPLWKLFRNISYLILILVMLTIGFLIMFRFKIDPQTVISIENALPKIILTMILITFSFSIAGFLIDLMYVAIAIIISMLSHNGIFQYNAVEYQSNVFHHGSAFVLDQLFHNPRYLDVGDSLLSLFPGIIQFFIRIALGVVSYILLSHVSPFGIGDILTGSIAKGTLETGGWIPPIIRTILFIVVIPVLVAAAPTILSMLIFLTALFVFFRIFFMVFRAYLEILLMIIFAPVILLFEAIPGKSTFSFWVKSIIGNLVVFPLVVLIMIVALIISEIPDASGKIWNPPFFGSIGQNSLTLLIGISILFMIPDIIKMVKEALGVKGLGAGVGIGVLFGGTGAAVGGGMGLVQQFSSIAMAWHYMPPSIRGMFGQHQGEIVKTGVNNPQQPTGQ